MSIDSQPIDHHMRQSARDCLSRAKVQASDDSHLRYACLELRLCIEFLALDRLHAYLEEVSDEALAKWTPKDIMSEILSVDPDGDKSVSLRFAMESSPGVMKEELKLLGEDRRFSIKWASKCYGILGNFLHAPTLDQIRNNRSPSIDAVKKHIALIIDELEAVLASAIFRVNFGNFFQLDCESCGTKIKRRATSIPPMGLICPNRDCRAVYDVTSTNSGFSYVLKTIPWTCKCGQTIYFPHNQLKLNAAFDCEGCGTNYRIGLTANEVNDQSTGS